MLANDPFFDFPAKLEKKMMSIFAQQCLFGLLHFIFGYEDNLGHRASQL
jgi:hypothetical protein